MPPLPDDETTTIQPIGDLSSATQQKSAYLLVISHRDEAVVSSRMFKLTKSISILGRGSDVELTLVDDGISRRHARFSNTSEGFFLEDLGSTNGTFLNGEMMTSPTLLKDGDKIQVGTNTVLVFTLQDELEEQFQQNMLESANRDSLTLLHNRKYFLQSLKREFGHSIRHTVPLSVAVLDVDHFKRVNDTHGHLAGDRVLCHIAQTLRPLIRNEDVCARVGGEEFALLLRHTQAREAMVCAERCRRAIESGPLVFDGARIRVTISIGVASLSPAPGLQAEDLFKEADRYLYAAKQAGRNRIVCRESVSQQSL